MYSIVIHGGAGTILRQLMTKEKETQYRNALNEAILIAEEVLLKEGAALDAAMAAVVLMENNSCFNAGKGAVYTHAGTHELDAAIMCGNTLKAGAVSLVQRVKNPIKLAKQVMDKSEHVWLNGQGAEQFAKEQGLEMVDNTYFDTPMRYKQWQKALEQSRITLDHDDLPDANKYGTVGAVVRDKWGNLAAATSTGGMTNKKYNRIGDTPIIGSATYANNATCAVSCTGHGEYFIRGVIAYDVSCLMAYKNLSLQEACDWAIHKNLQQLGGKGGLIAIDAQGNMAWSLNSKGMYRAKKTIGQDVQIEIFEPKRDFW